MDQVPPTTEPSPAPSPAPAPAAPHFRRRDFLKWSVGAVAGYGLVKAGLAAAIGPQRQSRLLLATRLKVLSPKQESIVTAVALAITGPAAKSAYEKGAWDPAFEVDGLLSRLPQDQRTMLGVAMHLFENWNWGLTGFTRLSPEEQLAYLAAWRTSSIALKRTTYGFLHAATAAAFSSVDAGWSAMDYPGPCVPSGKYTGRAPGQSTYFEWDPRVP